MTDFTAIVVGGGPAGLAAAALLAQAGVSTALVSGAESASIDPRTVALMMPSIRLLAHLGLRLPKGSRAISNVVPKITP